MTRTRQGGAGFNKEKQTHKYSGTAAALATLLWVGTVQADEVRVELGSSERVARLFAYPSNCSVICYRDWTLEQTTEHYLGQSLQRDGYADATATTSAPASVAYRMTTARR